jgi:hypothetical protein
MKFESSQEIHKNKEEVDRRRIETKKNIEKWIGGVFVEYQNPEERINAILERMDAFFKHLKKDLISEEQIKIMRENVESLVNIEEIDGFTKEVLKILDPIIKTWGEYAKEFEEAQARSMNETHKFVEINRLLSYGKSGSIIHIHAPHGSTVENKITLYREGLRKLAEIVNLDSEVKEINATSKLVDDHPSLFERAGFNIIDIPEDLKREHFPDDDIKKSATISRDEFLRRWLKKEPVS